MTRLRTLAERAVSKERQRGSATIEYVGIVIVAAAAFASAAFVGANGALVPRIQYAICQGVHAGLHTLGVDIDAECRLETTTRFPKCVTYRQDRLLGVNGALRFIRGEVTGKDQIYTTIDPVTGKEQAYVILSNEAGAGIGAGFSKNGLSVDGKVVGTLGSGVVYTFDSEEEAQNFLDSRRGNIFTRALGVITGGKADALFDGARHLWHSIFGGGDDDEPVPSGVTVDLGLQAQGNLGGELETPGNVVTVNGDLGAAGKASGQLRYNFDGTSQLIVSWDGSFTARAGLKTKALPFLGKLGVQPGGTFSGSVAYRVNFDEHGRPTTFTLTTETGVSAGLTAGADAGAGTGSDGEVTVHTYTLDLTTPEGMQAFEDTLPALAAGAVSPVAPPALLATRNPLTDALYDHAIEMEQVYDTEGDQLAATAPDDKSEHGLKFKGIGIGWNDDTARRTLRSARIKLPGGQWQTLSRCEEK